MSGRLSHLLASVSELPAEARAKVAAILGAVVADAASVPLQWIYEDEQLRGIVGEEAPEFWPECRCPYYAVPTGSPSCYGAEMAATLATLARDGQVKPANIAAALQTVFGEPESPYQVALATRRAEKKYPVSGPWINAAVIMSLQNMKKGKDPPGSQLPDNDGFTTALPAFLLNMKEEGKKVKKGKKKQVNKAELAKEVSSLVTVHSLAVSHTRLQNLIVANHISGVEDPVTAARNTLAAEYPEVAAGVDTVLAAARAGLGVAEVVASSGKECSLPGSCLGGLASVLLAPDLVTAVRLNILAGGDCCSRANFIGAVFGARDGIEAIPVDWMEKVFNIEVIFENALKVFASPTM